MPLGESSIQRADGFLMIEGSPYDPRAREVARKLVQVGLEDTPVAGWLVAQSAINSGCRSMQDGQGDAVLTRFAQHAKHQRASDSSTTIIRGGDDGGNSVRSEASAPEPLSRAIDVKARRQFAVHREHADIVPSVALQGGAPAARVE
jgi:hypothetical protein